MKNVFKDFCKLFGGSITVMTLMLGSFLLIINLYHTQELNNRYEFNTDNVANFNTFKDNVKSLEQRLDGVNINNLTGDTKFAAESIKGMILKGINVIKESPVYQLNGMSSVGYKELYRYNDYLYDEICNDAYFYSSYNIKEYVKEHSKNLDFDKVNEIFDNRRDSLLFNINYVNQELESNGSYFYVTAFTRRAIYNKIASNFNYIVGNYVNVTDDMDLLVDWYVESFGGGR